MKFLFVLIFLLPVANAAKLSSYWHQLPEEGGDIKSLESSKEDNLESIDKFLQNYVGTHLDVLDDIDAEFDPSNKGRSGFKFSGFQTSLSLGLSGSIGVLSYGGTKGIEIDWARKSADKSIHSEEEYEKSGSIETIYLDENTTSEQLERKLDPVIKSLVRSKKVKSESTLRDSLRDASKNFLEYSKGMADDFNYEWYPSKLRLDLSIKASGKVSTFFVKLGGDIRLRLEWVRTMSSEKRRRDRRRWSESKISKGVKNLLHKLSYDVSTNMAEMESKYKPKTDRFKFDSIQLGIGFSIDGKAGVVSLGFSGTPSVFFKRAKVYNKNVVTVSKAIIEDDIYLISPNETANISYADSNGISYEKGRDGTLFKLKRRKVRKGMKKAFKFSRKFADKLEKKADKRRKWGVKKIKSAYKFSISGSAGPVKLKASPQMAIYVVNPSL